VEHLSDRILKIVDDELPKCSLGLNIIGTDVAFGVWEVKTPVGSSQIQSYTIIIAIRNANAAGGVVLGDVPPITNSHALPSLWPSEVEIRAGVRNSCDALREYLKQQQIQGNGHPRGPVADIMRDLLNPNGDGQ
jgi:hypothetical protein